MIESTINIKRETSKFLDRHVHVHTHANTITMKSRVGLRG